MLILPLPALLKVLITMAVAIGLWNIRSVRRATAPENDPILIGCFLAAVVVHLLAIKPYLGVFEGLFAHKLADFQVAQFFVLALLVSGWWMLVGSVVHSAIELVSGVFARLVDLIVSEAATLVSRFRKRKPAAQEEA